MTSTTQTLRAMLDETAFNALRGLAANPEAMSGRMMAAALGVSPTTATAALGKLRDAGFAMSNREGRADRWRLNTDSALVRSWLEETRHDPKAPDAAGGSSPYSTGGGGVTFERKVAVQYLAHLLTGDGAVELGDGRHVVSVEFQQAPEHSVDDLVIRAARDGEPEPSLVLAAGVRRAPDLVQSDESTKKLICAFVREVIGAPADGPEHRCALVVAGAQEHAQQLAVLADLAAKQIDAPRFFRLVRTPGKFHGDIRGRLKQVEGLVKHALTELGIANPNTHLVEDYAWQLLSRLTVLMPRLETPDETDWAAVANSLLPVAFGTDLLGATQLRDRLIALADEYPPKAATVNLSMLRRDAHAAIDSAKRRHQQGWQALGHLHARATAVRDHIASEDGSQTLWLDRSGAAADLLSLAGPSAAAVVAYGDSGVGKSALTIGAAADAAGRTPGVTQALCINLRHLPATSLELEGHLGVPLAGLLAELSAPQRLLVIDGADAVSEGSETVFRYLADAARQADVTLIAVTANDTKQLVRDIVVECCIGDVGEYLVPPLTDAEVEEVIAVFGELAALGANPRSRELLRRPVVVDLLVRGGITGIPLSDADAMEQVWTGLVCRQGRADRGTPDARQLALLSLADLALRGGEPLEVVSRIDPVAMEGLRRDGLLQTSPDDPFKIGPEFAHDEVRRYAVARLLLSTGNPAAKLVAAGVPRWSLGSARLACQVLLAAPDRPANRLRGRLARLQRVFDDLVAERHGERWGDVPGEALLTLGDSGPVLGDAWAELRAAPGTGLRRLCRLVKQRLRDNRGVVRLVAIEPLIALLLDDETPFISDGHLQDLVRAWLRALVIDDTPAGHPLRVRLRSRLATVCDEADRRLEAERVAAAAARAALSPDDLEEERQFEERQNAFLSRIGHFRAPRRTRAGVPREITDEAMIEFLALLGPDLGDQGEGILRRVARDAPPWLHPAVEELATGRALASYRRGFLAELTEAYYLDEDEDGSGFHEDGIRRHQSRSFGVTPLAAWNRGPFMVLFQTDFRNGVAVLNRMLNHAAQARVRTLVGLDRYGAPVDDSELNSAYRTELGITGTNIEYVGDDHVWTWYRGTGVGPYPCMSALEALERVCDQLVAADVPLANIVAVLLDGCKNLAMPGLAVGLLVRHLEDAGRLLDLYLAEPDIWHLEFARLTHESSGLAASSDGIVQAERRRWSLREAGMLLVLNADDTRADELRAIGEQLVTAARRIAADAEADEASTERLLATVRSWASGLDRATYEARQTEGGIYVQSTPPDDVAAALQHNGEEIERAGEATRLIVRYYIEPLKGTAQPPSAEDLAADLAMAEQLLHSPPDYSPGGPWDAPAIVAATALAASIISGTGLPAKALRFAAETVIRIGEGAVKPHPFDSEISHFEQGADRSAARALPLLILPDAAALRASLDGGDGSEAYGRTAAAARSIARSVPDEVRVHLARGLDRVWEAPCSKAGACHHVTAFQLAVETMRDCVFGPWNPNAGRRQLTELADPVDQTLAGTADNDIHFARLDAAIRALAPAAQAGVCVSGRSRELLTVLLAAHRRSLLSYDDDMDDRGTHAMIAARALLTIAADSDDAPLHEHIDAYADNPALLLNLLRALSAAGEETTDRAATAARVWPSIVAHVIDLHQAGHTPFGDDYHGDYTLAALIPRAAGEVTFLYREFASAPVVWWQPLSLQDTVEQWLPLAEGDPTCVDQLISFMRPLPPEDQARVGLPWIARLVLASPGKVANRTFLLSTWLVEIRQPASDACLLPDWQRIVDALVVAGVTRLAPYSE
ncbi:MAG TPA: winged helix-turn-helix domain-containing protein [Trebonia sp.]